MLKIIMMLMIIIKFVEIIIIIVIHLIQKRLEGKIISSCVLKLHLSLSLIIVIYIIVHKRRWLKWKILLILSFLIHGINTLSFLMLFIICFLEIMQLRNNWLLLRLWLTLFLMRGSLSVQQIFFRLLKI